MKDFLKIAGPAVLVLGVFLGTKIAPHINWSIFGPYISRTVEGMLNPKEVSTLEDLLAKNSPAKNTPEGPTGEVVSVLFSPPQYVYFCFELADLSTLISAPTIADARAWFERFRIPAKTGLPRCDYLVNNETLAYVKVSRLENLRRVPTEFARPTATLLPLIGGIYQGSDGDRDYYVYLASTNLTSAARLVMYDFITAAFGPQP